MTRDDESGFTLIELVMTTMVLGIILATITGALILYLTATEETTDRLAESPEAQIVSVYLTRDAQSAEVDTSRCAQTTWTGNTHLVSFGWRDPGTLTSIEDDNAVIVSYVVASSSSNPSQKQLRRYECTEALDTPGATIPASITTAADTQTLVALLDPSTPVVGPSDLTSDPITVSFGICTAKSGVQECKHGTSLAFNLSVSRRTT